MIKGQFKKISMKQESYCKHSLTFADSDSEVKVYAIVIGDAESIHDLSDLRHLEYIKITDGEKVVYEKYFIRE